MGAGGAPATDARPPGGSGGSSGSGGSGGSGSGGTAGAAPGSDGGLGGGGGAAGGRAGGNGGADGAGGTGGEYRPDARPPADLAPRPDLPGYDVTSANDRPALPDGQFHYPALDGKLCGSDEYILPKFTADVLVLLDRSGSMGARSGARSTKWNDAATAVKATVAASTGLSWGLKLFPTGGQRCGASGTVEVPVSAASADNIRTAIDGAGPPMAPLGDGTPTTATVMAATAYLKSLTFPFPRYIVLATDGAPTCQADNPDTRDEAGAIAAIQEATAAGFKTFVIGIATATADVDTLNRMADAGGAPRPGATRYYPAANRAELSAALDTITSGLITCVFPLAHRPPDPSFVTVTVGSAPILRDLSHTQGWDYINAGAAIQIYGAACESLKRGTVQGAGIYYGCPR